MVPHLHVQCSYLLTYTSFLLACTQHLPEEEAEVLCLLINEACLQYDTTPKLPVSVRKDRENQEIC